MRLGADASTETTPLISSDDPLDEAEKGTYPLPDYVELGGELFETDGQDNGYEQPIITEIRDPEYSVPDDIGDKVFDDIQQLGVGNDYASLYALLTTPMEAHRYMRDADKAEKLRSVRKTGRVLLDLNFEYYPYALPFAVPFLLMLLPALRLLMDAILTSRGFGPGDSEINWDSFLYLLIPIWFFAIVLQKGIKEAYLLKRGDREAEFTHDYLAWLEANPQTDHPIALHHPRTKEDYEKFYTFHTGFISWLRLNNHTSALAQVEASIWRHFPYRPIYRAENLVIELPQEFDTPAADPANEAAESPFVFPTEVPSNENQSDRNVSVGKYLAEHREDVDHEEDNDFARKHRKEMLEQGLDPKRLGVWRVHRLARSQKPALQTPKIEVKHRQESSKREVCDVFSLPLISGGTRQLESGQIVKVDGFAFAEKSRVDRAQKAKTVQKNPVPPPKINSNNCAIFISSYASQLHAPLGHHLSLMPVRGRALEVGKIYLKKVYTHLESGEKKIDLAYKILESNGSSREGNIRLDSLPSLEGNFDEPLDLNELKLFLPEILEQTGCLGHGAPVQQRKDYSHTNFAVEKWFRQKLYTSPRVAYLNILLEKKPFQREITEEMLPVEMLGNSDSAPAPKDIKVANPETREFLQRTADEHNRQAIPNADGSYENVKEGVSIQESRPQAVATMEPVSLVREKTPENRDAVELQSCQTRLSQRENSSPQQSKELQSLGRRALCSASPGAITKNNVEYANMDFFLYDDPDLITDLKAISAEKQARFICALFFAGQAGQLKARTIVHSAYLSQTEYFDFIENYLACCRKDNVPPRIIANHFCFLVERPAPYDEANSDTIHRTQSLFEKRPKLACDILVALTHKDVDSSIPVTHAQRLFTENPVSPRVRRSIVETLSETKQDLCISRLLLIPSNEVSQLKILMNPSDRYFDLRYLFNSKNQDHVEKVYALVVNRLMGDLGHHQAQGIAYYFAKGNRLEEFLYKKDKPFSNAEILAKKLADLPENYREQARARIAFALMRTVIFRKKGLFKSDKYLKPKPVLIRELCESLYPGMELIPVFLKIGLQAYVDAWKVNQAHFIEILKYALHKPYEKSAIQGNLSTQNLLTNLITQYRGRFPKAELKRYQTILYTLTQVFMTHRLSVPMGREAFIEALHMAENWPFPVRDFFRAACHLSFSREIKYDFIEKLMEAHYQKNVLILKKIQDSYALLREERSDIFADLWMTLALKYAQSSLLHIDILNAMLGPYSNELPPNPCSFFMNIFCLAPKTYQGELLANLLTWLFSPDMKMHYKKFARPFSEACKALENVSLAKSILEHDPSEGNRTARRCTAMMIYSLYDQLYWIDGHRTLRITRDRSIKINILCQMHKALSDLHEVAGKGVKLGTFIKIFFKDASLFTEMGFSFFPRKNISNWISRFHEKWEPNKNYIEQTLVKEDFDDEDLLYLLESDAQQYSSSSDEDDAPIAKKNVASMSVPASAPAELDDKGKEEARAFLADINNSNLAAAPLSEIDLEEESTVSEEKITKPIEKAVTVRPEEKLSPPVEAKREPKKDSDGDELEGSTSSEEGSDAPLLKVSIAEPQKNEAVSEADEWPEDGEEDDEEWSEEDHIGSGFRH